MNIPNDEHLRSDKRTSAPGAIARTAIRVGLAAALAFSPLALAACGSSTVATAGSTMADATSTPTASGSSTSSSAASVTTGDRIELLDTSNVYSDRDQDPSYDASEATTITLSDGGSTASGGGVSVDGSTVTITADGTYVVTSTLTDGQLVVDAPDDAKVQIVLEGARITCSDSAAIYVKAADKVFLTLADGTSNSLSTTGTFADTGDGNTVDGAVFSKTDLTVNGSGSLAVTSAQGHGIVCKDDLVVYAEGGALEITAAGHAIQGKDSVAVGAGTLALMAGTDGIHCANDEDTEAGWIYVSGGTITVTADSDGFDAGNFLQVDGGDIAVDAGDDGLHAEYGCVINGGTITVTRSNEALEGSYVAIAGGTVDLTASDDGINAAGDPTENVTEGQTPMAEGQTPGGAGGMGGGMDANDPTAHLTISGGRVTVDAGGDGLDSNGDLTISGGEVYVSGPTNAGNGGLDYSGTGTVTGGTVIIASAAGMAQSLTAGGDQGVALVSATGSAGSTVELLDADGNLLASATMDKDFQCVVVSCAGMTADGTYTLRVDGTETSFSLTDGTYADGAGGMGAMGGGAGGMGGRGSMGTMGTTDGTAPTEGAPTGGPSGQGFAGPGQQTQTS